MLSSRRSSRWARFLPQGAILALVALAVGCAEPWPTAIRDPNYDPTPTAPPTATVTAQGVVNEFGETSFFFRPPFAPIAVGGLVTFRNESGAAHNVTFGGVSHAIEPGAIFQRSFNAEGSYAFTCTIHPEMTGSISVVTP